MTESLVSMSPEMIIALIGIFYILVFGALAFLRREGLSSQFAIEGLILTAFVVIGMVLTGNEIHPILFLVFIYLFTMRSRLLADLANVLSIRGRQGDAIRILQVAMRFFPDQQTRLIILVNMGIVQYVRKNPESARQILEGVLAKSDEGGLGVNYEAASHYHLGLVYLELGNKTLAIKHFNLTQEVFPHSRYGIAAEKALEIQRSKKNQKKGGDDGS